jgi:HSP20 family protein
MESMLLPSWRSIEARPLAPLLALDQPLSDFFEEPDVFVACLELPGFAQKDVDVEVTANRLMVEAHREEKTSEEVPKRGYFARERRYSALRREFTFPAEVNADATKAEFKDGILTVRCPKTQPTPVAKPHRVKVD